MERWILVDGILGLGCSTGKVSKWLFDMGTLLEFSPIATFVYSPEIISSFGKQYNTDLKYW